MSHIVIKRGVCGGWYLSVWAFVAWKQCEPLCSVRTVWIRDIIRLAGLSVFFSSVKLSVDWCVVVVVCRLSSVWDVWLDSARGGFPQLTDVLKPSRPPKPSHVTSDTPLSASPPWQALEMKCLSCWIQRKVFLFIFIILLLVVLLSKRSIS